MRLPTDRFSRDRRQEDSDEEEGNRRGKGNGNGNGGGGGNGGGRGRGKGKGQDKERDGGPPGLQGEGPPGLQPTDNNTQLTADVPLEIAPTAVDLPAPAETLVEEATSDVSPIVGTIVDAITSSSVLALPTEVESIFPIALAPEESPSSSTTTAAPAVGTTPGVVLNAPEAAQGFSTLTPSPTSSVTPLTTLVPTNTSDAVLTSSAPASAGQSDVEVDRNAPGPISPDPGFLIGTAGQPVPERSARPDPFPGFGDDMDSATAGYGGLKAGEKGGIAVGTIAGFAFILTIILFFYKWRKGTLPPSIIPRFITPRTSRAASLSPEMSESLVEPEMRNHRSWRYQDTFAKPSSIYRLRRSFNKLLTNNPLAANPVASGAAGGAYPSEKADRDNRKSWASSLFRSRGTSSRASSRMATRLFVRGKGGQGSPLDEAIPPLPPAYDRRSSRHADAWSRSSLAPSEASSHLQPFHLQAPRASGQVGGSIRDSVTFGAASRRSRYSFAGSRKSMYSLGTAAEGSVSSRGEGSSVAELALPPVPNLGLSAWSTSGDDGEGSSVRSGASSSGKSSALGVGRTGGAPTRTSNGESMPLPPGPTVHPLRAHSLRPVVNERFEEDKMGPSWPL